jgi:hypothetical protein
LPTIVFDLIIVPDRFRAAESRAKAMDRTVIASTTAIGIVLVGGIFLWWRQPEPGSKRLEQDVRIVRGTGPGNMRAGQVADQGPNGSAPSSPDSQRVELKPATISEDAELEASLPDPALEPRALYKRVRTEPRDEEWAARSERNIRAALAPIPYISPNSLRVSCGSTLCEVRGIMPKDLSMENMNVAMQALQGEKLRQPLAEAGLQQQMASFGGGGGTPGFTIYATRR